MLFVTVDPDRDTAAGDDAVYRLVRPRMFWGCAAHADQLYALARRYRVVFSVTKTPVYSVTHSSAVYVFDASGKAQFIIAGLDATTPDIEGIARDLK